ncbi:Tll0287-like domain-containing protein [Rhodoligotrophos ferricapiens]|uniref:Tll0287-like domain-containing protein n=1 Tax=Rhodoligotrophos ferricapiens TaxID=3069264 RepID=UPI00315CC9FA
MYRFKSDASAANKLGLDRSFRCRMLGGRLGALLPALVLAALLLLPAQSAIAAETDDSVIAVRLAQLLQAARTVVSQHQDLINNPNLGEKGLTADRLLAETVAVYQKQTGHDPYATDPNSKEGRLLRAQMEAIKEIVVENQSTINKPGLGFKGFIPAVFARLVNEKFAERVGTEARVKVTAPEKLIRNRKARPDDWEVSIIESKFSRSDWPKGGSFEERTTAEGRPAFRLIVPEYYVRSCLMCHGEPAGKMDITGYPMEGGKEGDLGAAVSVTLFE